MGTAVRPFGRKDPTMNAEGGEEFEALEREEELLPLDQGGRRQCHAGVALGCLWGRPVNCSVGWLAPGSKNKP